MPAKDRPTRTAIASLPFLLLLLLVVVLFLLNGRKKSSLGAYRQFVLSHLSEDSMT
jgi:hypothetical protein